MGSTTAVLQSLFREGADGLRRVLTAWWVEAVASEGRGLDVRDAFPHVGQIIHR